MKSVFRLFISNFPFLSADKSGNNVLSNTISTSELIFRTRYAIKEKASNIFCKATMLNSFTPVVYINFTRGISRFIKGNYNYHKSSSLLDYQFRIGYMGRTNIAVEAGLVSGGITLFTVV